MYSSQMLLSKVLILVCSMACSTVNQAQTIASFKMSGQKIKAAKFDAEMSQMLKELGVPGVSLALLDQGRVVYEQAYGVKKASSSEKVDLGTVFEACSLSKSFLVFLVYKLVEEGKLDLHTPMYHYLEPGPSLDYDPRYKSITPHMILSHSSGLEDWSGQNKPDSMEILNDPGKKFHYSSLGYNYLSAALEQILKKPYDEYMPEFVFKPLGFTHSFTRFSSDSTQAGNPESPANYASGHTPFEKELPKWKNYESVPSSAVSTSAGDYARLILYLTDAKHLSAESVKKIITPVVPTGTDSSPYYYGTGFEIIMTKEDTIIGHGGSNYGFKAQMFYSVKNKRGFVFLTNSDLGKLITSRLNAISTRLDIEDYYKQFSVDQYPSQSVSLLKLYKQSGAAAMFERIELLKKKHLLQESNLSQLGKYFIDQDSSIARRLFVLNLDLFPTNAYTYLLLGDLNRKSDLLESALSCYTKAIDFGFKMWDIQPDIDACYRHIAERERRKKVVFEIVEQALIQVEDFNTMSGIQVEGTADSGGGLNTCYADPGDWMEYKLNLAETGMYKISFRIANDLPGSSFALLWDETTRSTIQVQPTKGWQSWQTQDLELKLEAGTHQLRINFLSGASNLNWIKLQRMATSP